MQDFLDYCNLIKDEIKKLLKNRSCIVVYHSNDADGICSLFSFTYFLKSINCVSKLVGVESIDEDVLKKLLSIRVKNVVFLDLGSGYLDYINKLVFEKNVIVIDHHKPQPEDIKFGGIHVNPELYGYNGQEFCSAATLTAYMFQDYIEPLYLDVPLIGALGDLQDKDSGRLNGLNREILKKAKEENVVYSYDDLNIYYTEYDIVSTLMYMDEIDIYELSERKNIIEMLEELGINYKNGSSYVKWKDLSKSEKIKIINYIALKLLEYGDIDSLFKLTREQYISTRLHENCRKVATLVNSMTKYGYSSSALRYLYGKMDKTELNKFIRQHKANIKKSLEVCDQVRKDLGPLAILDLREHTQPGIVGSVIGLYQKSCKKPFVLGIARQNGQLKISMRALNGSETNVSEIIRRAASKVGGYGGGHKYAGGAMIPESKLQEFIKEIHKSLVNEPETKD